MSRARVIPAVDHLLGLPAVQALASVHGSRRVRQVLDEEVSRLRAALIAGHTEASTREFATALVVERLEATLVRTGEPSLRPVINATGVVIHTNLGRAPLSAEALDAMRRVGEGYSTLEFDLETGQRGSRHQHLDAALRDATGAEAGLATNNTAAGLTLALAALATGREVIISRGELVEIGGGFRVPDILRGSGALLREVGTTNRTRAADYAAAISDRTAAILRVHPSNFRMEGFTERPALADLAALARRFSVPLVEDQGSGWLGLDLFAPDAFPAEARAVLDARARGARERPRRRRPRGVQRRQAARWSTGWIACRARRPHHAHPAASPHAGGARGQAHLRRAGGHAAGIHERPRHDRRAGDADARDDQRLIVARAESIAAQLRASGVPCDTAPGHSTVGGGSLPGETLPTRLVRIESTSPDTLLAALRARVSRQSWRASPTTRSASIRGRCRSEDDAPLARAIVDAFVSPWNLSRLRSAATRKVLVRSGALA